AVGMSPDGGVTLQAPHHRTMVSILMNTPGRRGERFTCLSFLLVLAPKRDIEGFRDFLTLRIHIEFLDHELIVLDRNDLAAVLPHVGINCRKVTLTVRGLN